MCYNLEIKQLCSNSSPYQINFARLSLGPKVASAEVTPAEVTPAEAVPVEVAPAKAASAKAAPAEVVVNGVATTEAAEVKISEDEWKEVRRSTIENKFFASLSIFFYIDACFRLIVGLHSNFHSIFFNR